MSPRPSKRGKEKKLREVVEIGIRGKVAPKAWTPTVGPETVDLLNTLGFPKAARDDAVKRLRTEAIQVFSRCTPPDSGDGSQIGLVVGYVQSGKTMSFTVVAALARDNGYQMVIVIAGTSLPLLRQSTARLRKDLRLDSRLDRKWQPFVNPSIGSSDEQNILAILEDWNDPDVAPSERRTVLITVMKQHTHLASLNELLLRLPMAGRPVLIIDDEADQAGLNTAVRRKAQSPTYKKLLALRRLAPHHSYLQYTATPQAPLLINLIDVLSPRFAEVLTPGSDYVGGQEFFVQRKDLVRIIPEKEIPSAAHDVIEPPETLLLALRLFFLGVAAGMAVDSAEGNRSMLVHPSQLTDSHATYLTWVRSITRGWSAILELKPTHVDRRQLVTDFSRAYKILKRTVPKMPSFVELEKRIKQAIRHTRIQEINTRLTQTPEVSWNAAYPHILVGGQAMDRGFTVEGLTITYMPRGLGVGNADTIQQRARFFGYKRSYIGYCRVFLSAEAHDAYRAYVIHEEDVRRRLVAHNKTGKDLSEWKREFFLTRKLKPARRSVMDLDYMRIKAGDDWWNPAVPHATEDAVADNRQTVSEFVADLKLAEDAGHTARTRLMRHKVAKGLGLSDVLENVLTKYRVVDPEDSAVYTNYLLILRDHLEKKPNALCDLYLMSGGELRDRRVDKSGGIPTLFQGPHPDKDGHIYPGDRNIKNATRVTIQIHNLRVLKGNAELESKVPTLAIWIPKEIAPDMIAQAPRALRN